MRELLVGTKKGLFVLRGDGPDSFEVATRAFEGDVVEFAIRDHRTGRYFASVTSGFFGPRVMWADDPLGEWQAAKGPAFPEGTDTSVDRIWAITPGEADGVLYAGLVPRYVPEGARAGTNTLCVHNMHRAPAAPERLFMQFHGSVYRSDDAGSSWNEIAEGLPSGFGFPLAIDPADPDSAFVIPLTADADRVTPEVKVRVFETRDAGRSWTARDDGLPRDDAWLTVLRQALGRDGEGSELGLWFGATSGEELGSADAGRSWATVDPQLAPVTYVRV